MAKVLMKKARKKTSVAGKAKKSTAKKAKTAARPAKKAVPPQPALAPAGDKLSFNHAMVYVKDVQRALDFYRSEEHTSELQSQR